MWYDLNAYLLYFQSDFQYVFNQSLNWSDLAYFLSARSKLLFYLVFVLFLF